MGDIDKNLGDFVAMRPDLFGTVEEEIIANAQAGNEEAAKT